LPGMQLPGFEPERVGLFDVVGHEAIFPNVTRWPGSGG